MKPKNPLRKLLALLLPAVLILTAIHIPASAKNPAALNLAIISDPHVYPADMTDNYCPAFIEEAAHNGRAIEATQGLFAAALASLKARAAQEQIDFLLVPGDMTEWSEYAGHILVAGLLRRFESETGIPVAVVPGNHDLELGDACDFSSGAKEPARALRRGEFSEVYAELGYDLPNCERFEGGLSYAADLGGDYRLIAMDTTRWRMDGDDRFSKAELRDWALAQCEKARAAGKVVIGMGHYNLGEQMGGQDSLMGSGNLGFDRVGETAEAFADAGMHFYFSGHLHFNEIAVRVSDRGETLYDIMTASSGFFPGGYRTANFSAAGGRIEADVRSVSVPLTNPSPFPDDPYYSTLFGRCYGSPDGGGLVGWLKYAVEFALGPTLRGVSLESLVNVDFEPLNALLRYIDKRLFGQPERLLEIINGLVEEIVAMPVSRLPCTRFIDEYGFGDPDKPGTFEDLGNSALIYLFGKSHDAADDAFVQDALRRMQNGEFVDQLLNFAVPKIIEALGGGVLPLLANSSFTINALGTLAAGLDCPPAFKPLLALLAGPNVRGALSESLYQFASGVMAVQSPTGARDGVLVYDGAAAVPLDPGTFRLPQELSVSVGLTRAEITWYTRSSANTPELIVTDQYGNPAPEVSVSIESVPEDIMAGQLDIGYAKLMGYALSALKHTARLTGLKPGKAYRFTAGDSARGWRSEPRGLNFTDDNPVTAFFKKVWDWLCGMLRIFQVWRINAEL